MSQTITSTLTAKLPDLPAILAAHSSKPGLDSILKAGNAEEMLRALIQSGASINTIMLAQQIVECDQFSRDALTAIDNLRVLRETHQQRINDLNALATFVKKQATNDENQLTRFENFDFTNFMREYPGILERYAGGANLALDGTSSLPGKPTPERKAALMKLLQHHAYEVTDSGAIKATTSGQLGAPSQVIGGTGAEGFSAGQIEMEAKKHESEQTKIDSSKQLLNMRLQEFLQQKLRLTTLASNWADLDHQTLQATIKNIHA